MQKARAGMALSDEDRFGYTAARAFLFGEWLGALIMVSSVVWLYASLFVGGASAALALGVGLAALALGGFVFWANRRNLLGLDGGWDRYKRRFEVVAVVFAGTGAVFWLLFALLAVLVWNGVPVQP